MVTIDFTVTPFMTMPAAARLAGDTVLPVGRSTSLAPSTATTCSQAGRMGCAKARMTMSATAERKM